MAVQSKFFAVGAVVPYAKAGVGAIASQAFGNTTFGPKGLALLAEGQSVEETLELLLAPDDFREQRQVGVVDAEGNSAAFTGTECMDWAGHVSGKNYTAQGNILVGEDTVKAMARAFEEAGGHLLMKSDVRKINVKDGAATGVEIETGPQRERRVVRVDADAIISAGESA